MDSKICSQEGKLGLQSPLLWATPCSAGEPRVSLPPLRESDRPPAPHHILPPNLSLLLLYPEVLCSACVFPQGFPAGEARKEGKKGAAWAPRGACSPCLLGAFLARSLPLAGLALSVRLAFGDRRKRGNQREGGRLGRRRLVYCSREGRERRALAKEEEAEPLLLLLLLPPPAECGLQLPSESEGRLWGRGEGQGRPRSSSSSSGAPWRQARIAIERESERGAQFWGKTTQKGGLPFRPTNPGLPLFCIGPPSLLLGLLPPFPFPSLRLHPSNGEEEELDPGVKKARAQKGRTRRRIHIYFWSRRCFCLVSCPPYSDLCIRKELK
nr:PREDICTED: uncharacterized protein LOC103279709 [Anolis carolinensis]|eukprot:XP_008114354.1 PREDICTED: uncharacterized protein LOC103279709 [Anolis carolinensis]